MRATQTIAERVLIEAVEGCGIAHWAVVDKWEPAHRAEITERGGARHVLDAEMVNGVAADVMNGHSEYAVAGDVDGYLADQVVQIALFGQVVYH